MAITLDGTNGINSSGVIVAPDGSASAPSITNDGDTNTGIYFPAADTIAFAEGGVESMRINSSGNLGVGTSSPGQRLHIANTGSTAVNIQFENSSASNIFVGADTTNLVMYNGGSERARITSGGDFCVNATSSALSTKLYVAGSIGAQLTYGPMFVSNENNTDNVGRSSFNFQRGGVLVGQIVTTNSTCAYNSVSDYRLKENIQPMTSALAKVAQLNPVTYTWKSNGTVGQGFIAHELQAVVPDCVSGEKDAVNEDGSIKPQGVDTSFLVATLTAAIKEQQTIIESLQARIEALENNNV